MRLVRVRIARSDAVLLIAMAAVALGVALAAVSTRPESLDDRAWAIEAQLRCPTCQGLSIADSPATSAVQMRALVREQLAAGGSDDAVRAFFVARYGRWILLDPPASGPDLALWLAPALIVAVGAAFVVRRARARGRAGAARGWSNPPPLPPARLPSLLVGATMVLALAVPIAAAVGPRLAGSEISGGSVAQSAPAIDELEAFVAAEPRDIEALVALGDALVAANRAGDAADRYRAALVVDPSSLPALLGIGTILLAADRPDAAGPVFDRILDLAPDHPDALLYRAVARLRTEGRVTDLVRKDIERFLEVAAPEHPGRAMANGLLPDTAPSASPELPATPESPQP